MKFSRRFANMRLLSSVSAQSNSFRLFCNLRSIILRSSLRSKSSLSDTTVTKSHLSRLFSRAPHSIGITDWEGIYHELVRHDDELPCQRYDRFNGAIAHLQSAEIMLHQKLLFRPPIQLATLISSKVQCTRQGKSLFDVGLTLQSDLSGTFTFRDVYGDTETSTSFQSIHYSDSVRDLIR